MTTTEVTTTTTEAIKSCYRNLREPVQFVLQGLDRDPLQMGRAIGQIDAYLKLMQILIPERTKSDVIRSTVDWLTKHNQL